MRQDRGAPFDFAARARPRKYYQRADGSPKIVFGSEFVSGCYQPGRGEIGLHCDVAHFPNRDGKYTTPWDRKPIG